MTYVPIDQKLYIVNAFGKSKFEITFFPFVFDTVNKLQRIKKGHKNDQFVFVVIIFFLRVHTIHIKTIFTTKSSQNHRVIKISHLIKVMNYSSLRWMSYSND